ncbi:MAG: pyruvate dehydrogenase (acetyl-transferring), homodimeric type, partial [Armatimonadota bacterium]|nr:pyruvate dehydrogenase (acetyl-transferring), homodimeric type [Armatimonadota bacterium]
PETLGAISLASREKLDNLIFVINCNLQRLDGPVRGNGKIIQELEAVFRGAGWNVIKVIWGTDWDPLLAEDDTGELVQRMGEIVDGQYQKYTVETGAYAREHFFGKSPTLRAIGENLTDDEIRKMTRGGHDSRKVYAAYKAAVEHKGQPTVILAKTIKGYGLGEAGEGKNVTHQQKALNDAELRAFRTRFNIPISDEDVALAPFYRLPDDSAEMKYLCERRSQLGGPLPHRKEQAPPLKTPSEEVFQEFYKGSGDSEISSTGTYVRILTKLMRDKEIGKLIVTIIPDEARTFGMDSLFRQFGIYSHVGQLYEPVDASGLMYYKEAKDGQILEEGINEAGSMGSFIAAGTAYASHGINTIPFYTYYSMFGPQRVGDMFWAAGDLRCRGFLVGGTAGRTTLSGEGLQHQDGHSHLFTYAVPNCVSYDPAFVYEQAVIIRDGIRRMYEEQESIFFYMTVMNENYPHPAMPEGDGIKEGILKGMYRLKAGDATDAKHRAQLFGSGAIVNEVLIAQKMMGERYGVNADVWSITSYPELIRDGINAERWNLLHPNEEPQVPYVTQCLKDAPGVFVAASDYVKALPLSIAKWVPGDLMALGTDGFGRSDNRGALRDFFEVKAPYIVLATLTALAKTKKMQWSVVKKAIAELKINPDKLNPLKA